uniref:ABC transporter ATP-binding protein n=1 Tax=Thermogemmatispora argillosa TaxID=2045280 RepID=A0A455T155_9CHLR|nr:ABC transporter ATP-binding protein [Thermogemmatispora argillosa]
MPELLQLQQVSGGYHGRMVVHEVSLSVAEGEAVAAVGANGAGKTTLLRLIMGQLPLSGGRVLFEGRDLGRLPTFERVRLGIGYVPEGRALFPEMSVEENLEIGAYRASKAELRQRLDYIYQVFPKLQRLRQTRCRLLSGGEQQMVTVGRALMTRPRLLILDEPSTGLAPRVVGELYQALRVLHSGGLTVFVVEQNAYAALRFAQRGYVFEDGHITRVAPAAELLHDPHLVESYVGRASPMASGQGPT